jgi:PleD family two-component response regulator
LRNNTPYQHSKPDQQEHQQKEKLSPFTKRILIVDDHPDNINIQKRFWKQKINIAEARFSSKSMLMMIPY